MTRTCVCLGTRGRKVQSWGMQRFLVCTFLTLFFSFSCSFSPKQRLPLQASAYRRLWCRKVLFASSIRRWHLHWVVHFYHWCWLCKSRESVLLVHSLYSAAHAVIAFAFLSLRKFAPLSLTERLSSFRFGILLDRSASVPLHLPTIVVPMVLLLSMTWLTMNPSTT